MVYYGHLIVEGRQIIRYDGLSEGDTTELLVGPIQVIVDDDEIVRSLFCIFDLLERSGQALGHGNVCLSAAPLETGAKFGQGRRGDKEVDRVQVRGLDLADALEGVFGRRGNAKTGN